MSEKALESERRWRRLYTDFASVLSAEYTLQEIADLFYEFHVIDAPEAPTPERVGTKREYVLDTLHHALRLKEFLRVAVPRVVLHCDLDGVDVQPVIASMTSLGYELEPGATEAGVASYLPPKRLPTVPRTPRIRRPRGHGRITIPDLPNDLQELVDELNDCLDRGNRNAAALMTRKIIHKGVFVAMRKRGKEDELKRDDGDDVDLSIALKRCKQACGVSSQAMGRIISAKWIGDSANHSFRVSVTDEDLERTVTGLRLFLQEIL